MIGVSNPKSIKYITKAQAEKEFVPKKDFDTSIIDDILNSINTLNNEVVDINTDITTINSDITTINSNVSNNTTNIQNNSNDISNLSSEVNTNTTNITTNTTDISDLKTRMTTAEGNISTNTNNISTNTTDISNLKTRMTAAENNINTNTTNISTKESKTSHNTDIQNLRNQINNLNLGSPFEGYYYSIYPGMNTRCMVEYNYNKGKMMYANDGSGNWKAALNDVYGTYMDMSIKDLILPGNVKQISSSGTITAYVSDITYVIDSTTERYREVMPNLTTITTEPNVYKISFELSAAPNLRYFNLLEGLQEIYLSGTLSTMTLISLRIPASVHVCELRNIKFQDLIFESGYDYPNGLKLTYYMCHVRNKLSCKRYLTSETSINAESTDIWAPNVLECLSDFVIKLSNNNSLGKAVVGSETMNTYKTTLFLYYNENLDIPGQTYPRLTFKAIYNYTYKAKSAFNNFLYSSNWYPNA